MAAPLLLQAATDRRDFASRQALLRHVSREFVELPPLRLTLRQCQRLFDLRRDICQRVLGTLVRDGSLTCDGGDQYRLNESRTWTAGAIRPR